MEKSVSDKQQQRGKRTANFTKEEEILLMEEVEKQKNILECKATDKISNVQKVCGKI